MSQAEAVVRRRPSPGFVRAFWAVLLVCIGLALQDRSVSATTTGPAVRRSRASVDGDSDATGRQAARRFHGRTVTHDGFVDMLSARLLSLPPKSTRMAHETEASAGHASEVKGKSAQNRQMLEDALAVANMPVRHVVLPAAAREDAKEENQDAQRGSTQTFGSPQPEAIRTHEPNNDGDVGAAQRTKPLRFGVRVPVTAATQDSIAENKADVGGQETSLRGHAASSVAGLDRRLGSREGETQEDTADAELITSLGIDDGQWVADGQVWTIAISASFSADADARGDASSIFGVHLLVDELLLPPHAELFVQGARLDASSIASPSASEAGEDGAFSGEINLQEHSPWHGPVTSEDGALAVLPHVKGDTVKVAIIVHKLEDAASVRFSVSHLVAATYVDLFSSASAADSNGSMHTRDTPTSPRDHSDEAMRAAGSWGEATKQRDRNDAEATEESVSVPPGASGGRRLQGNYGESSQPCEVNLKCEGDPWNDPADGIALLIMNDYQSLCTGSIVRSCSSQGSNADDDSGPYLLTARHCLSDAAYAGERLPTLMAVFKHYTSSCDSSESTAGDYWVMGARVLALSDTSDVALLKLEGVVPWHYGLYANGWDRNFDFEAARSVHGIHHPAGDVMMISSGQTTTLESCMSANNGSSFYCLPWGNQFLQVRAVASARTWKANYLFQGQRMKAGFMWLAPT